jgi:hypothetical protein
MTSLGKVLVYLNLFVAVGLFAWSVSLYANRPDWFDRDLGEGGKAEGQLTKLGAEVKRLTDAATKAQRGYAASAALLAAREAERDYRKAKLDQWLAEVTDDNNRQALFRQLPRVPNSPLLNVNAPALAPAKGLSGQDLPGLGTLRRQFDELVRTQRDTAKQIKAARDKSYEVSVQVEGVQAEVLKQKDIRVNLKDQEAYLADKQIDWDEQLRTLKLREGQLTARLNELKDGGRGR